MKRSITLTMVCLTTFLPKMYYYSKKPLKYSQMLLDVVLPLAASLKLVHEIVSKFSKEHDEYRFRWKQEDGAGDDK